MHKFVGVLDNRLKFLSISFLCKHNLCEFVFEETNVHYFEPRELILQYTLYKKV